jgi:hypothetical protein
LSFLSVKIKQSPFQIYDTNKKLCCHKWGY